MDSTCFNNEGKACFLRVKLWTAGLEMQYEAKGLTPSHDQAILSILLGVVAPLVALDVKITALKLQHFVGLKV